MTALREEETAALYAAGLSYVEIATEMGVGVETVKSQLKRFRRRYGIESRRDLIQHFRDLVAA